MCSATEFEHQDWLGTERARTNVTGTADVGTYFSLPYGDGYAATGSDDDPYHFATLDRDTTVNEDAQFCECSDMARPLLLPRLQPGEGERKRATPCIG